MIKVVFKNLEKSELAKNISIERLQTVVDRFPLLASHKMSITLSMENSPNQPGLDVFTAKLAISGRRFKWVIIEKSAPSLYQALADLVDHTLEILNRYGDRERVIERQKARKVTERQIQIPS